MQDRTTKLIGLQSTELAALERLKIPHRHIMEKMVFTELFLMSLPMISHNILPKSRTYGLFLPDTTLFLPFRPIGMVGETC